LLRVDGGHVWGVAMGHVRRSLLLAKALAHKYNFIFVMKNHVDGVSFVKKQGYRVREISINDDSDETLINLCEELAPEKIIFDLFQNPYEAVFNYARKKKIHTIVFDILGKSKEPSDILINDSFVPAFVLYPFLSKKTKLFYGPKYFILGKAPKIQPVRKAMKDVMLTMGGADPAGLTVKILNVLLENALNYRLHVVLGPAFREPQKILNLVAGRKQVIVYQNPKGFLSHLSHQDLVISAAGRTLYECAYFGRPVVVVPSIEHEAIVSSEFGMCTGNLDIGLWDETSSPAKIKAALDRYNNAPSIRRTIFKTSRCLVDGLGLKRVLHVINKL